jgi:hypothetical protein
VPISERRLMRRKLKMPRATNHHGTLTVTMNRLQAAHELAGLCGLSVRA